MAKNRRILELLLLGWIIVDAQNIFSDTTIPPYSYSTTSANGKFVFVMISPVEMERDGDYLGPEDKQKSQKVREKYSASGLYLNNGSNKALWTVNWYAYNVLIASDGVHLVRNGPWASSGDDEAITFFAAEKQVKTYKVSDLVRFIWYLPHSVSHFVWEKSQELDDKNKTYTLETLQKDKFVFDITTGDITSSRRPSTYFMTCAALIGIGVLALIIVRVRGRVA